jgi:hypothetical protein
MQQQNPFFVMKELFGVLAPRLSPFHTQWTDRMKIWFCATAKVYIHSGIADCKENAECWLLNLHEYEFNVNFSL